jgi:hypothetical protein
MIALFILLSLLINPALSSDIVTVIVRRMKLEAGSSITVRIQLEVKEGYHIQAHNIADEYLIPTSLDIEAEGFVIEKSFPLGTKLRLEGSDDTLDVYDGTIEIDVTLRAPAIVRGKSKLRAKLHYQACDAKRCFPPRTLGFVIPIDP